MSDPRDDLKRVPYLCGVESWFSSPYYPLLYAHRDIAEARHFVQVLLPRLRLPKPAYALDAGCGTGRYAYALAEAGLVVDAVDQAVTKPNLPESVRFFLADLRSWTPDRSYHLIGSFFTSFGIGVERWDELVRLVRRFSSWLLPGGWLVLDYLNIHQANRTPTETRHINGIRFDIERRQEAFHLYKLVTVIPPDGPTQTYEERVFKLTLGDMLQLLERAGLSAEEIWGDYEGNPFVDEQSPRLIALAQKPLS